MDSLSFTQLGRVSLAALLLLLLLLRRRAVNLGSSLIKRLVPFTIYFRDRLSPESLSDAQFPLSWKKKTRRNL